MKRDTLDQRLRRIPVPEAVDARERTVADARAEVAGRSPATRPSWTGARRLASLGAAVLIVIVVLLTPPGRAASAWVGELVGIGEVGGSPTREHRGFEETSEAVVIDNGQAPDGSRYEWVAYRCEVDMSDEGIDDGFRGIGVSLEWPGDREGGGSCEEGSGASAGGHFTSHGVRILASQSKGVERPVLTVSGSTGPRVHDVRIVYTDRFGDEHSLPVDFARVDGKLRELAHRPEPLGTFTAFIPGDWAARDEVVSRLDLRALYGTGELELGPLGRHERAQARQAFEACERYEPDPDSLPASPDRTAVERAYAPYGECLEQRMPPSPVRYVAYDREGRELDSINEPLIAQVRPAPSADDVAGREEPGDRRWPLPGEPKGSQPLVLMSGRAPEGALYEVHATRSDQVGHCMTIWWPYVREAGGGGSCGPGLPPETAFGPDPEQVAARPFGYLTEVAPATAHWLLSGYARPAVDRVEVRYRDRDGAWHDAPVKLAQLAGAKLGRAGGDRPFGFWVAFVPRSVDRCQGGRPERCMALRVVAYGEDGGELGRVKYRSD